MNKYKRPLTAWALARHESRLKRQGLKVPSCRPPRRNLIQQAPYIPSPEKGKRWENGKQVARKRA